MNWVDLNASRIKFLPHPSHGLQNWGKVLLGNIWNLLLVRLMTLGPSEPLTKINMIQFLRANSHCKSLVSVSVLHILCSFVHKGCSFCIITRFPSPLHPLFKWVCLFIRCCANQNTVCPDIHLKTSRFKQSIITGQCSNYPQRSHLSSMLGNRNRKKLQLTNLRTGSHICRLIPRRLKHQATIYNLKCEGVNTDPTPQTEISHLRKHGF